MFTMKNKHVLKQKTSLLSIHIYLCQFVSIDYFGIVINFDI